MTVEHWALALAGSPWVFLAMYAFATVDGFFPPIPSESLIIALAAVSGSSGDPNIVLLVLAAAAGAFTGDQVAYQIGTKVQVRSLRVMRSARAQSSLDWAEGALERRGASFIIAARYIPVGRVAVNMTAGALDYRRRRFMVLTGIAAVLWAAYSAAIGLSAGALLKDHPFVAVAVGVVGGILLGFLVDWLMRTWTGRRGGSGGSTTGTGEPGPVTDGSRSVPPG